MEYDFLSGLLIGFFAGIVVFLIILNNTTYIVDEVVKKINTKNKMKIDYFENNSSVMSFNCDIHNRQQICNGIVENRHLWKCPYKNCEVDASFLMHKYDETLIECKECNIKWTVHFERLNK